MLPRAYARPALKRGLAYASSLGVNPFKFGMIGASDSHTALSDGRSEDREGRVRPVGSTVDVKNATYTNSIGAPELRSLWTDPDFDPSLRAVYYVRVLEIPTPAWPAYDQKHFGVSIPDSVPKVVQNRAYTSPIWYTPAAR